MEKITEYKRHIFPESIEDNANDLAEALQAEVLKIFPKSMVDCEFSNRLYNSITLRFSLGKDKSEYANGYVQNDPFFTSLQIDVQGKELSTDGSLPNILTVTCRNQNIVIKPSQGSYSSRDNLKVPFRKTNGDSKKIIDTVKKYFISVKKTLQDNRDKLIDEDLKLIGDKF